MYARVGKKLIQSIRHPTVVRSDASQRLFPHIHPVGVREAIARVLQREASSVAETRWCDAVSSGGQRAALDARRIGPRLLDKQSRWVGVAPRLAFTPIRRIGGRRGWYAADWMWKVRGYVDLLMGGVGLRRGRRDPEHVHVGEPLDFWRVEAYEPDRRLVLRAEMKLPGRAWLEFEVEPEGTGSRIHQTAIFDPRGVLGRLYWWLALPLHAFIFSRMLRRIAQLAVTLQLHHSAATTSTRCVPRPERAKSAVPFSPIGRP